MEVEIPEDFPRRVNQTSVLQGVRRDYARRSLRKVRYGVRLPCGAIEPACSAHHVSAIVQGVAGPEGRFTAADVANYMSGRHAASMLERIPDGVEIYSVGPRGTVGSPDAFSVPVSKAPCCARLNEDADSLVPDPDSTDPLRNSPRSPSTAETTERTASAPPPPP